MQHIILRESRASQSKIARPLKSGNCLGYVRVVVEIIPPKTAQKRHRIEIGVRIIIPEKHVWSKLNVEIVGQCIALVIIVALLGLHARVHLLRKI